jgi:transcriptional regulator GlxA family with amidase domain
MVTIRLARDLVERAAADALGMENAVRTRFTLGPAVSPAADRSWARMSDMLQREVAEGGVAMSNPLVARSMSEAAAATLVGTHRLITDGVDPQRTGIVGHAAVRRAVMFMEDNAEQPLTVGDIAAAARVGPRALQEAFRRHLETTPLGYLRDIRLVRAHAELCAADGDTGVNVTTVAYRWGFSNLGRFAALYRRRFGHSPSRTLRS